MALDGGVLFGEQAPANSRARHILLTLLRLAVGVGLLVYLVKSGTIDLRVFERLLTRWPVSALAIGLILADILLMSMRLSTLFRPHGLCLSLRNSCELTLVGFFFGTLLPGAAGGDLAKLYYATRENSGRRTQVATIILFDRAVGLISLLFLPLLFAPAFPNLIRTTPSLRILLLTSAVLVFGLISGFMVCLFYDSFMIELSRRLSFLPGRDLVRRMLETVREYRRTPGTLLMALGMSLLANLAVVAVTALAVLALDPAACNAKLSLIIPIGHILNSLPLTPGGIGVGEAAFNALFRVTGLRGGAEALLCWRFWTALVSVLGLGVYLRGFHRGLFGVETSATSAGRAAGEPVVIPAPPEPVL